jgi:hypothetical protein
MPAPTSAHLRRVALTTLAATAVVLGPTACDIRVADLGSAGSPPTTEHAGGHGGATGVDPTSIVTVPAGNVEELPPTTSASADPEEPDAETTTPAPDGEAPDGGEAPAGEAPDGEAPEGEAPDGEAPETTTPEATTPAATTPPAAPPAAPGLETLGADCTNSDLEPHDGFQNAPRCVSTSFGEVADEDNSPSLLIVDAPQTIGADEDFTLEVSTRNLVRDRFLGAAAGGYYRESSFLNGDGIQRGHFHTACRKLEDLQLAPNSQPAPEFFLATQDNGGGAEADVVSVPVPGLTGPGTYQCAVWAGDGSHRVPMMQRANQTPAFDAVRVVVE